MVTVCGDRSWGNHCTLRYAKLITGDDSAGAVKICGHEIGGVAYPESNFPRSIHAQRVRCVRMARYPWREILINDFFR